MTSDLRFVAKYYGEYTTREIANMMGVDGTRLGDFIKQNIETIKYIQSR